MFLSDSVLAHGRLAAFPLMLGATFTRSPMAILVQCRL